MTKNWEVWRCAPCGVTWVDATMTDCWCCGNRPTHVKPYRPEIIVGSSTMRFSPVFKVD